MKTTIELPDALVKQVKQRARRDGQKLQDAYADLLRQGLAIPKRQPEATEAARIGIDEETGLPIILGTRPAPPGEELTPDQIKDILLAQEVEWFHEASR